ncbi:MAG: divergent PAP2 family protein [Candidatus Pacebacteria bacterium]|nr:divergent PAP2 family protein [Candidatus Paceibacterota bacterium]
MKHKMIYPIVLIPIIVGLFTQVMKFLLSIVNHRKVEMKYLFTSGHMPSSHTSFVVSLATLVALSDSIYSTTFAISFVFAFIVIHDAIRIRMNIGENGKIVNKLIKEVPGINKENYPILRERVGHKPLEVLGGGIFGFFLTLLLVQFF